jgi:hypothetical protein
MCLRVLRDTGGEPNARRRQGRWCAVPAVEPVRTARPHYRSTSATVRPKLLSLKRRCAGYVSYMYSIEPSQNRAGLGYLITKV